MIPPRIAAVCISLLLSFGVASCEDDSLTDMNQFRTPLLEMVQDGYTGTVSDSGGNTAIPCRFDGRTFQMTFDKFAATDMRCQDPERGAAMVNCSSASIAYFDIPGSLTVQGESAVPIVLSVTGDYNDHCKKQRCENDGEIRVEWWIEMEKEEHLEVYGGFDEIGDIQNLGDEISTLHASINHGMVDGDTLWESCIYRMD